MNGFIQSNKIKSEPWEASWKVEVDPLTSKQSKLTKTSIKTRKIFEIEKEWSGFN
jgi:hypothetical protein